MAKMSEKYEVMYIINPNFSEEQTAAIVEKFKALVEANGTLDELEEMGKRKLCLRNQLHFRGLLCPDEVHQRR